MCFELKGPRGYFTFLSVVDCIMLHNTSLVIYSVETLFYIFRCVRLWSEVAIFININR